LSHHELVARPRETSAEAATLAASRAADYIQAASHPYRTSPVIPARMCIQPVADTG